jgi:hypothetical protein
MAKKIRRTQEEEVIKILRKEGFKEISEEEIQKEPYKSIYSTPDCFNEKKVNSIKEKSKTLK